MLRLYDFWESGNCYKVRLLLSQLGEPFERVPVDILQGQTRTESYLKRNPNHRVPLLEWPDGRTLAESNAILFCIADGTPFLPADPWSRAQVLQWMFFEQYSHEPYIAVVRFWHFTEQVEQNINTLPGKMYGGYGALGVMEQHLATRTFFVRDTYSIADIALYAYTHVADEGGFELDRFPAIQCWLSSVSEQANHVAITDPVGVEISLAL
ncbi:MAG: glutathione S-transferase family protein [Gammaproteobacteria bacterium]|nr:glutathione S-transferase family protein [Gammaproteobacteria bacterium]MDH3467254.1 glutathione S-transferase family protein [Gammaproteobacteria bacterium]